MLQTVLQTHPMLERAVGAVARQQDRRYRARMKIPSSEKFCAGMMTWLQMLISNEELTHHQTMKSGKSDSYVAALFHIVRRTRISRHPESTLKN